MLFAAGDPGGNVSVMKLEPGNGGSEHDHIIAHKNYLELTTMRLPIQSMAFSPDGSQLVVLSAKETSGQGKTEIEEAVVDILELKKEAKTGEVKSCVTVRSIPCLASFVSMSPDGTTRGYSALPVKQKLPVCPPPGEHIPGRPFAVFHACKSLYAEVAARPQPTVTARH